MPAAIRTTALRATLAERTPGRFRHDGKDRRFEGLGNLDSPMPTPHRDGDPSGPGARCERIPDNDWLDALLHRAMGHDHDAVSTLVQLGLVQREPQAQQRLMVFARHHLATAARRHRRSPSDDPESMAQAGVVNLLRRSADLRLGSVAAFLAYLDQMARNWAADQDRTRKVRAQTSLGGESEGHRKPPPTAADQLPTTLSKEHFEFLLSRCADAQDRFVLRMRFEEASSYEEIGRAMQPPRTADAVRMQASRALVRLGRDPRVMRGCDHAPDTETD